MSILFNFTPFILYFIPASVNSTLQEIFTKTSCGRNFVHETNFNSSKLTYIEIENDFFYDSVSSNVVPVTLMQMDKLSSFALLANEDEENSEQHFHPTSSSFPFPLRFVANPCVIFLLETNTVNSTEIAVKSSGYVNSEFAIFLKLEDTTTELDIYTEFFTSIVFFVLIKSTGALLSICDSNAKNNAIKYNISSDMSQNCPYSQILGFWRPTINDGFRIREGALKERACVTTNRAQFYAHILKCISGYFVAIRITASLLNISFSIDFSDFEDQEENGQDYLNIHWLPILHSVLPVYASSKLKLVGQSQVSVIHCRRSGERKQYLNIFAAFHLHVWLLIIATIGLYILIYQAPLKAIDLFWVLIGYSFTAKHKNVFIFVYLPCTIVLSSTYNAVVSNSNMFGKSIESLKEFAEQDYKYQAKTETLVKTISISTPKYLQKSLSKAFGVTNFVSDMVSKEYGFTDQLPLNVMLHEMTYNKILGIGNQDGVGFTTSFTLSNILAIVKSAIIDGEHVCGSVQVPEDVFPKMRTGYLTWGPRSTLLNKLMTGMDEMGVIGRNQKLLMYTKGVKDGISWSEVSASLNIPTAISLRSTLGVAGIILVVLNVLVFAGTIICKLVQGRNS